MFDFGFSELVLIGLIALIVLGPERLPEVARAAGRWAARLRRFIEDVKRDIDREVQDENLIAFRKVQEELTETRNILEKSTRETFSSLSEPLRLDAPTSESLAPATETQGPIIESPAPKPAKPRARSSGRKKSSARKPTASRATASKKTTRTKHGGTRKPRSR